MKRHSEKRKEKENFYQKGEVGFLVSLVLAATGFFFLLEDRLLKQNLSQNLQKKAASSSCSQTICIPSPTPNPPPPDALTQFNVTVWEEESQRSWGPGNNCSAKQGVQIQPSLGSAVFVGDELGGHFDVVNVPINQPVTLTLSPPSSCGFTCDNWILIKRSPDLSTHEIVKTGEGCSFTFTPETQSWRSGVQFTLKRIATPTSTLTPILTPTPTSTGAPVSTPTSPPSPGCPANLQAVCLGPNRLGSSYQARLTWTPVANTTSYTIGLCNRATDPACQNPSSFSTSETNYTLNISCDNWYGWWVTANPTNCSQEAPEWFKCDCQEATPTGTLTPSPTASPTATITPTPTRAYEANWTAVIYFNGASNLYSFAQKTLEAIKGLNSQKVNIVALFKYCLTSTCKSTSTIPRGTQIVRLIKRYNDASFEQTTINDNLSFGNPQVLVDLINLAKNFPAEKYYLNISDHGNATAGISWDKSTDDYLTNEEIYQALSQAGLKFNLVHLDACLMSNAELGNKLKDYVDYLIAYENLGWSLFAHKDYLQFMEEETDPLAIAQKIADFYFNNEKINGAPRNVTVTELKALGEVLGELDNLAEYLTNLFQTNKCNTLKNCISNARSQTQKLTTTTQHGTTYNDHPLLDLVDFANKLKSNCGQTDPNIISFANNLIEKAQVAINYHLTSGSDQTRIYTSSESQSFDLSNTHGLSLFFPTEVHGLSPAPPISSKWRDFLTRYFQQCPRASADNTFPLGYSNPWNIANLLTKNKTFPACEQINHQNSPYFILPKPKASYVCAKSIFPKNAKEVKH